MNVNFHAAAFALTLAVLAPASAGAQTGEAASYPNQVVKIIVPFQIGRAHD